MNICIQENKKPHGQEESSINQNRVLIQVHWPE